MLALNSSAGSADDRRVGAAVLELAQHGSVRVVRIDKPWEAAAVAREHRDERLVLVGGDGTISRGVDELMHTGFDDRPIALLPSGTGNDYAGALGMPTDARAAARALVDARATRLSALRIGDRYGVNVCHVGIGAAAARAASSWKDRIGSLAYPLGAALAGMRSHGWSVTVSCDGRVCFDGELLMIAVALGRTVGGGTSLVAKSSIGSDRAQVLIAAGRSAADRGRLGVALLRGEPRCSPIVEQRSATQIDIASDRPIPVDLDGDDLGAQEELTIEVVPDAWTALVPVGEPRR